MRLGLKFAVSLVVPLALLIVVFGVAYQQTGQAMLRDELAKEGRAIALVVQTAAEDYLRDRQLSDLRKLVDQVSGYERVLGLRIFDPRGKLVVQSAGLDSFPEQTSTLVKRVIAERRTFEMHRTIAGQAVVGFVFPLAGRNGRIVGAGQVLQLESYIEADAAANRRFILLLTAAMVIATVSIVFLVTRLNVSRPIREMVRSVRQVGAGDPIARVPVRSDDELGRLAAEFNGMCERLERAQSQLEREQQQRQDVERQLRNAERLAGLGRLAAGLAHEIGTPLNVISGRADALRRQMGGEPRSLKQLDDIRAQSDRIVRIIRDMLDFARMQPPRRQPTSVADVLGAVLDLSRGSLEAARVEARLAVAPDLPPVRGDSGQLQQVFLNLVMNAADAMPGGGVLELSARAESRVSPRPPGVERSVVTVEVRDTGSGIPPENREHIFDPFFTTKEPGRGMGLGLAVSYGIVEEHDGWFEVDTQPGRGTRMTVCLPVAVIGAPVAVGSAS